MATRLVVDPYRLRELRDQAGIKTDTDLAQRLNISRRKLYDINHNGRIDGYFIAAAHEVLKAKLSDPLYKLEA